MNRLHQIAATTLLALSLPVCLSAQEAETQREIPGFLTVSVVFQGGSMDAFVETLRKSQPRANIVLAVAARDALVPSMELKDAGIQQALEAACMAADAEAPVHVAEFKGNGEPVFSIVSAPRTRQSGGRRSSSGGGDDAYRVLSLNELTKERLFGVPPMKVETVLSALDMALGQSEGPDARIRFHEESGILIVHGTSAQVQMVDQVLSQLSQDLQAEEQRAHHREQEQRRRAPGAAGGAGRDGGGQTSSGR